MAEIALGDIGSNTDDQNSSDVNSGSAIDEKSEENNQKLSHLGDPSSSNSVAQG